MSDGPRSVESSPAAKSAAPASVSPWRLYQLAVAAMATAALLATPLGELHDGLWQHLAAGRALLAGDVADASSGWLFSALLYLCWSAFGFAGPAILRGALYAALLAGIGRYLSRHGRRADSGWLAWIFGLLAVLGFQHAFDSSPHAASAPILVLALLLLEGRQLRFWALPLATLLWMNLDGRNFSIVLLIAGAYTLEEILARRRTLGNPSGQRWLAILALSMAMVFATPRGLGIVDPPRVDPSGGAGAPAWHQLVTLQVSLEGFDPYTPRNLLLLCGVLALIGGAATRKLRVSHAVLAAGAFWLAAGDPPSWTAAILLMPLIVDQGTPWPTSSTQEWTRHDVAAAGVAGLVLLAPFAHFVGHWPATSQGWPLTRRELPAGATAFLDQQGALAFRQLHPPAADGYWRWVQSSRTAPGSPSPSDQPGETFERASAFVDPDALARYLLRRSPELIAAPLDAKGFSSLIARHPRFRPVFFDDAVLLYADQDLHPELVARHELLEADPAGAVEPAALTPERRARLRAELERLASVAPAGSALVGESLAKLDTFDGAAHQAMARLGRVLESHPDRVPARAAFGDILRSQGDLEGAIGSYRRALAAATPGPEANAISRRLADGLAAAGDLEGAFDTFENAVGRFNIVAPAADLQRLGELALAAGKPELARKFLDFAALKLAPGEVELRRQLEEVRTRLPNEGLR